MKEDCLCAYGSTDIPTCFPKDLFPNMLKAAFFEIDDIIKGEYNPVSVYKKWWEK